MTGSSAVHIIDLERNEVACSRDAATLDRKLSMAYTMRDVQARNTKRCGASKVANYPSESCVFRYQKRSRAAKSGGSAPVFRQEEIVLWIDKENWTNDLQLQ